jgi:hypothetical protein
MSNDKRKQAKKKQRERDIQHRKHADQQRALRQAKLDEYPTIRLGEQDADPEFINAVLAAARQIDFLDEQMLMAGYRDFLRRGKTLGFQFAYKVLDDVPGILFGNEFLKGNLKMGFPSLYYGLCLFQKIPEEVRKKYLPINDVMVTYEGRDIILRFTSIRSQKGPSGSIYYSPHKPTIAFAGTEYTVGFYKHAIERICQRIRPNFINYGNAGELHAFFRNLVYFEPAVLLDDSPAFVMYDLCNDPDFSQYKAYTVEVFGEQNIIPEAGKLYYKVGYCPVSFVNGFAIAKTFLPVGFSKTPEYGLLLKTKIPYGMREELKLLAKQDDESELEQFTNGNIQDIKWFHQNGMPQVVQMKKDIFLNWFETNKKTRR